MRRTAFLYLRRKDQVLGPFGARRLQAMARDGELGPDSLLSADAQTWIEARRVRGLFEAAETPTRAPAHRLDPRAAELKIRIDQLLPRISSLFTLAVTGAVILSLAFLLPLLHALTLLCFGPIQPALLTLFALLPAGLLAALCGFVAGGASLRLSSGLSRATRRWLALHLPYSHVAGRWPKHLANWIYGGDWLRDFDDEPLIPYVRVFLAGKHPQTPEEELSIWDDLFHAADGWGCNGLEAGASVREISFTDRLPTWSRTIEPGANLARLQENVGPIAREWAQSLLQRAAPHLAGHPSHLEEAGFEFFGCHLRSGQDALVVIVRPRSSRKDHSGDAMPHAA